MKVVFSGNTLGFLDFWERAQLPHPWQVLQGNALNAAPAQHSLYDQSPWQFHCLSTVSYHVWLYYNAMNTICDIPLFFCCLKLRERNNTHLKQNSRFLFIEEVEQASVLLSAVQKAWAVLDLSLRIIVIPKWSRGLCKL